MDELSKVISSLIEENLKFKTSTTAEGADVKAEGQSPKGDCHATHWTFVKALVAILLGSVLVNLWIRVINNFTYHTLKLNPDSFVWATVIALVCTGFLVLYIAVILDEDTSVQVRQTMTGVAFVSTAAGFTGQNTPMEVGDLGNSGV